jgi:broad-specificity NMP kinase
MIIQIIGTPGTGKSYAIKKYLSKMNKQRKAPHYLDIADYKTNYNNRYYALKNDILKKKGNVIIESACGIKIKNAVVIKYKKDKTMICKNLKRRNEKIDMDYISLLENNSIKQNYTVTEMKTLHKLLDRLLFSK